MRPVSDPGQPTGGQTLLLSPPLFLCRQSQGLSAQRAQLAFDFSRSPESITLELRRWVEEVDLALHLCRAGPADHPLTLTVESDFWSLLHKELSAVLGGDPGASAGFTRSPLLSAAELRSLLPQRGALGDVFNMAEDCLQKLQQAAGTVGPIRQVVAALQREGCIAFDSQPGKPLWLQVTKFYRVLQEEARQGFPSLGESGSPLKGPRPPKHPSIGPAVGDEEDNMAAENLASALLRIEHAGAHSVSQSIWTQAAVALAEHGNSRAAVQLESLISELVQNITEAKAAAEKWDTESQRFEDLLKCLHPPCRSRESEAKAAVPRAEMIALAARLESLLTALPQHLEWAQCLHAVHSSVALHCGPHLKTSRERATADQPDHASWVNEGECCSLILLRKLLDCAPQHDDKDDPSRDMKWELRMMEYQRSMVEDEDCAADLLREALTFSPDATLLGRLDLLADCSKFLLRPRVSRALHDVLQTLVDEVHDYVNFVESQLVQPLQGSELQRLSALRDMSPVSGAIARCKQWEKRLKQIDGQFSLILGQSWKTLPVVQGLAQRLLATCELASPQKQVDAWVQQLEQDDPEGRLQGPIFETLQLPATTSGSPQSSALLGLKLRYSEDLVSTADDIRRVRSMGFRIPHGLLGFAHSALRLYPAAAAISVALQNLLVLDGTLDNSIRTLISLMQQRVYDVLFQGTHLEWEDEEEIEEFAVNLTDTLDTWTQTVEIAHHRHSTATQQLDRLKNCKPNSGLKRVPILVEGLRRALWDSLSPASELLLMPEDIQRWMQPIIVLAEEKLLDLLKGAIVRWTTYFQDALQGNSVPLGPMMALGPDEMRSSASRAVDGGVAEIERTTDATGETGCGESDEEEDECSSGTTGETEGPAAGLKQRFKGLRVQDLKHRVCVVLPGAAIEVQILPSLDSSRVQWTKALFDHTAPICNCLQLCFAGEDLVSASQAVPVPPTSRSVGHASDGAEAQERDDRSLPEQGTQTAQSAQVKYASLLDRLPPSVLDAAHSIISEHLQRAEVWVGQWKLQAKALENAIQEESQGPTTEEDPSKWAEVLHRPVHFRESLNLMQVAERFGPLYVDGGSAKETLQWRCDQWKADIVDRLAGVAQRKCTEASDRVTDVRHQIVVLLGTDPRSGAPSTGPGLEALSAFVKGAVDAQRKVQALQDSVLLVQGFSQALLGEATAVPKACEELTAAWVQLQGKALELQHVVESLSPAVERAFHAQESEAIHMVNEIDRINRDYESSAQCSSGDWRVASAFGIELSEHVISSTSSTLALIECGLSSASTLEYTGHTSTLQRVETLLHGAKQQAEERRALWQALDCQGRSIDILLSSAVGEVHKHKGLAAFAKQQDPTERLRSLRTSVIGEYPAVVTLERAYKKFSDVLLALARLSSLPLEERHWAYLLRLTLGQDSSILGHETMDRVALAVLQGCELPTLKKAVEATALLVNGELSVQSFFLHLDKEWGSISLDFHQHARRRNCWVPVNVADVRAKLGQQHSQLGAVRLSPFSSPFAAEREKWETKMGEAISMVEAISVLLTKWADIEGVMASESIQLHLPRQTERFQDAMQELEFLLQQLSGAKCLTDLLAQYNENGFVPLVQHLVTTFTEIASHVHKYLEQQRRKFPRLFFVGDRDLLALLSSSPLDNYQAAQACMPKLFHGVQRFCMDAVITSYGTEQHRVTAVVSPEGEYLALSRPVPLPATPHPSRNRHHHFPDKDEASTDWLSQLESTLKDTLLEKVLTALTELRPLSWLTATSSAAVNKHPSTESAPRTDASTAEGSPSNTLLLKWMQQYPVQVVALSLQVAFTAAVDSALGMTRRKATEATKSGDELHGVMGRIEAAVRSIAREVTRASQPNSVAAQGDGTRWRSLITVLVDQRETVRTLLGKAKAHEKSVFWHSTMRHYLEEDEAGTGRVPGVVVCVGDAEFVHGLEYAGAGERLVYTQLTHRTFLALSQALWQGRGGSLVGPAGTGKTETVKALAMELGRPCLLFSCDHSFDAVAVRCILEGVARVGAWACFDEFNRLDERTLSAVSQNLLAIQRGLSAGEKAVCLNSGGAGDVPLNSKTGIFVTMNPRYAGREHLPDTLRSLLRTVALAAPDSAAIAEVILLSSGFHHARELARKLVSAFQVAEETIQGSSPEGVGQERHNSEKGSAQYCDFSLRALKASLQATCSIYSQQLLSPKETATASAVTTDTGLLGESKVVLLGVMRQLAPKLGTLELEQLESILCQFFKLENVEDVRDAPLVDALHQVCSEEGLCVSDDQAPGAHLWFEKVLQLAGSMELKHGVVLVGPTGTGKTAARRVLQKALVRMHGGARAKAHVINPKGMTREELFGHIEHTTREWTDGVFTQLLRRVSSEQQQSVEGEKVGSGMSGPVSDWIVFDGDMDPLWVETLNSLLDNSKVFTIPNGERLQMPAGMRFIFECPSLAYATPATISRLGVVCFSDGVVSLPMLLRHHMHSTAEGGHQALPTPEDGTAATGNGMGFLDSSVLMSTEGSRARALLAQVLKQCPPLVAAFQPEGLLQASAEAAVLVRHALPFNIFQGIDSALALLQALVFQAFNTHAHSDLLDARPESRNGEQGVAAGEERSPKQDDSDDVLKVSPFAPLALLHAIVWGLGSSMEADARSQFSKRIVFLAKTKGLLPDSTPATHLSTHFADPTSLGWAPWEGLLPDVPEVELDRQAWAAMGPVSAPVVSTEESIRNETLIRLCVQQGRLIILCGPAGSGKTLTLSAVVQGMQPQVRLLCITFSFATTAASFLSRLDLDCEYLPNKDGTLVMQPCSELYGDAKLVVLCDEINLAEQDAYGTQQVVMLLTQMVAMGGFWHATKRTWVSVKNLVFAASCNPPSSEYGGRAALSPRFLRLSLLLSVPFPAAPSLLRIYQAWLGGVLRLHMDIDRAEAARLAEAAASAMMGVYGKWVQGEAGTGVGGSLSCSPRELSRWVSCIQHVLSHWGQSTDPKLPAKDAALRFARVWLHEGLRVWQDRLQSREGRGSVAEELFVAARQLAGSSLSLGATLDASTILTVPPPTSLEAPMPAPKLHSNKQMRELVQTALQNAMAVERRDMAGLMEGVIATSDCVQAVSKAAVVLQRPLGHVLLLGPPGTGKATTARLAPLIAGGGQWEVHRLAVHQDLTEEELAQKLRQAMVTAVTGGEGGRTRHVCLVLEEAQLAPPGRLEKLNSLLTGGNIPGLFSPQDEEELFVKCRALAELEGRQLSGISRAAVAAFFAQQVQSHLRVLLTASQSDTDSTSTASGLSSSHSRGDSPVGTPTKKSRHPLRSSFSSVRTSGHQERMVSQEQSIIRRASTSSAFHRTTTVSAWEHQAAPQGSAKALSPALMSRCFVQWVPSWGHDSMLQLAEHWLLEHHEQIGAHLTASAQVLSRAPSPRHSPLHGAAASVDPGIRSLALQLVEVHDAAARLSQTKSSSHGRGAGMESGAGEWLPCASLPAFAELLEQVAKLITKGGNVVQRKLRHLRHGLGKLAAAEEQGAELEVFLKEKSEELQRAEDNANTKLVSISDEQTRAEAQRQDAQRLATDVDNSARELEVRKAQAEARLQEVEPAVQEAKSAVQGINKRQLDDLRALPNPPQAIKLALEGVCLLLTEKKPASWQAILSIVRKTDFIPSILNCNIERIKPATLNRVKAEYLANQVITFESVNRASRACGPLVRWLEAVMRYSQMLTDVKPLRERVDAAQKESTKLEAKLTEVQAKVETLTRNVERLQIEYKSLMAECERTKAEIMEAKERREKATALLDDLGQERERWGSQELQLQEDARTLVPQSVLAAAQMAYLGSLPVDRREQLVRQWQGLLFEGGKQQASLTAIRTGVELWAEEDEEVEGEGQGLGSGMQHAQGFTSQDITWRQNLAVLTLSVRPVLLVDPTEQVVESFLKAVTKAGAGTDRAQVVHAKDPELPALADTAVRLGLTLVVREPEGIGSVLAPLLGLQWSEKGRRKQQCVILSGKEVPVSPAFRLFLITTSTRLLAAGSSSRAALGRLSVLHCQATAGWLVARLQREATVCTRAEAEAKHAQAMVQQRRCRRALKALEIELLDAISMGSGSVSSVDFRRSMPEIVAGKTLIEDEGLSATLTRIRAQSMEMEEQMRALALQMAEAEAAHASFRPLAVVCCATFFLFSRLREALNPLYLFPLPAFLLAFKWALKEVELQQLQQQHAASPSTRRLSMSPAKEAEAQQKLVAAALRGLLSSGGSLVQYKHQLPLSLAAVHALLLSEDASVPGEVEVHGEGDRDGESLGGRCFSGTDTKCWLVNTEQALSAIQSVAKKMEGRGKGMGGRAWLGEREGAQWKTVIKTGARHMADVLSELCTEAASLDAVTSSMDFATTFKISERFGKDILGCAAIDSDSERQESVGSRRSDREFMLRSREMRAQHFLEGLLRLLTAALTRPDLLQERAWKLLERVLVVPPAMAHPVEHPLRLAAFLGKRARVTQPVLVVCHGGSDACPLLAAAALADGTMPPTVVPLGSSEAEAAAQTAVREAYAQGRWVVLANMHLALASGGGAWLWPMLEQWEREREGREGASGEKWRAGGHAFCLFLTVEAAAHRSIPSAFAERCHVAACEPPPGLRGSLLWSLEVLNQKSPGLGSFPLEEDSCAGMRRPELVMHRVKLGLAILHAVILERMNYIPHGWTQAYDFTNDDFLWACQLARLWLPKYLAEPEISARAGAQSLETSVRATLLPVLELIVLDATYGPRLENASDRAVLKALVNSVFSPALFTLPIDQADNVQHANEDLEASGSSSVSEEELVGTISTDLYATSSQEIAGKTEGACQLPWDRILTLQPARLGGTAAPSSIQDLSKLLMDVIPEPCPPEWLGLPAGAGQMRAMLGARLAFQTAVSLLE